MAHASNFFSEATMKRKRSSSCFQHRTEPGITAKKAIAGVRHKASGPISSNTSSIDQYRKRLKKQGKYKAVSGGCTACTAHKSCAHDPPLKLPPTDVAVFDKRQPLPRRGKDGCRVFADHLEFQPNLTPADVLQLGSFGGTYFRDIESAVTNKLLKGRATIEEFPKAWFKELNVAKQVCSSSYDEQVNQYKVTCGVCLGQWETSGWISPLDPYGWFQWYCRFFLGRRSSDDDRQIGRFRQICSLRRGQLCGALIKANATCGDTKVSPVMRQSLQHWAYRLTPADLRKHRANLKETRGI